MPSIIARLTEFNLCKTMNGCYFSNVMIVLLGLLVKTARFLRVAL